MRILLVFLLLQFSGLLTAHPVNTDPETLLPQPFIDIMHARHEGTFYDQQASDWQALATSECGDDEAWFHYYKTANYSNRFGSGTHDLAEILAGAVRATDPNGFVYNYLKFAHQKDLYLRDTQLLRAHAADTTRHEAYTAMVAHHEIKGDYDRRDDLLQKLHVANPLSAAVMDYNFNQLHSVAEDGILITNGDADTYPTWLLQSAYGVRPDVLVVNLHLLRGYRIYLNRTLAALALETYPDTAPPPSADELIVKLAGQPRPVFLAATARPNLEAIDAGKLYLTGLAFRYSEAPVDNLRALANGYQNHWRLESLRQPLADGPVQAVADQLNQNYLPALLELYEYNQAEKGTGLSGILPLIETLAERAGRSEEVATYLRGDITRGLASSSPGITAKEIDKAYVAGLIQPSREYKRFPFLRHPEFTQLRMGATEISNADYQLFLEDLLRQRRFDALDSVAITPVDIELIEPESLRENADVHFAQSGHPAFANYPLVNVSHQAARLYARWLTEVYNADPKRKDGRNVVFRLPTAAEFEYAQRGGIENAPYAWGGPYYRNFKGCLLANFNTLHPESVKEFKEYIAKVKTWDADDKRAEEILEKKGECDYEDDGGYLTVAVDAYYPNDYGLYTITGNAAEMLAEEGRTMGGSWLDPGYSMQNGVIIDRKLPHPSTGFRLIMEYID